MVEERWNTLPLVTSGSYAQTLDEINPEDPPTNFTTLGSSGQKGLINNWNGGGIRFGYQYYLVNNGGHGSWDGNDAYMLDLLDSTLGWRRIKDPYEPTSDGADYYATNEPSPGHSYNVPCYIPTLSGSSNGDKHFEYFRLAIFDTTNGGNKSAKAAVYDFQTNAYLAEGDWPDWPGGTQSGSEAVSIYDSVNELVWCIGASISRRIRSFNPRDLTYSDWLESQFSGNLIEAPIEFIPTATPYVVVLDNTVPHLRVYDVSNPTSVDNAQNVSISGLPGSLAGGGLKWEPIGQKLLWYGFGSTIYKAPLPANPQSDTWVFSAQTNASGGEDPGTTENSEEYQGAFKRIQYSDQARGLVLVNSTTGPTYFWPVSESGM